MAGRVVGLDAFGHFQVIFMRVGVLFLSLCGEG